MGDHIRVLVRGKVERIKDVKRHAPVNGHRNISDEYYNDPSILASATIEDTQCRSTCIESLQSAR